MDDDLLTVLMNALNLDEEGSDRFVLQVSDELIASKFVKR